MDNVKQAFGYLNAFKRSRAYHETAKLRGNHKDQQYHELQMYKQIDQLELSLRGIQKDLRENESPEETEDMEPDE